MSACQTLHTAGEFFPDGASLSLVRGPNSMRPLALLYHRDGTLKVLRRFRRRGRTYLPSQLDLALARQLRLPNKAIPTHSPVGIFNQVSSLITKYCSLSEDAIFLAASFVFCSYFPECLTISPCLLIRGGSAEASTLLRLLSWACRHPVLLSDPKFSNLPSGIIFTRLIYSPGSTKEIEKLLKSSQFNGSLLFARGNFHRSCGCNAIYIDDDDVSEPASSGCLQIVVTPGMRPLTIADEARESAMIEEIQSKLLGYRLSNFDSVRESDFDVPSFSGATRNLARDMGACFVNAPELRARLISLLAVQDSESRMAHGEELKSIVLEGMLLLCHQRKKTAYVGEIATATNHILLGRGMIDALDGPGAATPREVGGKVRSLGFQTTRLDEAGRGIAFDAQVVKRVHALAQLHDTATSRQGLPGCPFCREL